MGQVSTNVQNLEMCYEHYTMGCSNIQLGYTDIQIEFKISANKVTCTARGMRMDNLNRFVYIDKQLNMYPECKECVCRRTWSDLNSEYFRLFHTLDTKLLILSQREGQKTTDRWRKGRTGKLPVCWERQTQAEWMLRDGVRVKPTQGGKLSMSSDGGSWILEQK